MARSPSARAMRACNSTPTASLKGTRWTCSHCCCANTASIALHRAAGFRHVGTLTGVGRKLGRWLDTVLMQRSLVGQP